MGEEQHNEVKMATCTRKSNSPSSRPLSAAAAVVVEAEKLYTLAVIPSDAGKWMVPNMDDWVELSAVRNCLFMNLLVI